MDDDQDDREMLAEAIGEMMPGAKCMTAGNGVEALKILMDIKVKPQLIFLDLNMPKMNGLQCMSRLKNLDSIKSIPVVIYTTSRQETEKLESERLGSAYFLVKPSSYKALQNELNKIFTQLCLCFCIFYISFVF